MAVLPSAIHAQQSPAAMTLQQAISLAQEHGDPARAAAATRDAARYRHRAFYSRLLPQLSLGGTLPSYNRSIIQVVQPDGSTIFVPQNQTQASLTATLSQQIPFTGGDFFVTSSLARLSISGEEAFRSYSSTPVSFGIRQPLFRPNVASWDRREESVRGELSERQFLEAREDIAIQTAVLFFDVYAARVARDNAARNAVINDTLYTLNNGRFQVGRIGENDLLQSELQLLRSRTTLDGARLEYDRALAALRLALNLAPDAPLEIAATGVVPDFDADTTRAVAEALENRASVSDVALQEVTARRRVSEARLAPGLGATVQASYGFNATGDQLSLAYRDLLEARQFSVSVQFPLWQWGARKETLKAAEADRDRVASNGRNTIRQTAQEAHFAALQLSQARRSLVLSAKADTVATKRFEVAYNRYVIGRIAIDNLFLAQNEKDQARNQYVQALRNYWQAHYRLRRL
ncbi:MAG: TolC family protein, partial [Gemmatimonadales bacterium]